jgi:hypothetical protein
MKLKGYTFSKATMREKQKDSLIIHVEIYTNNLTLNEEYITHDNGIVRKCENNK